MKIVLRVQRFLPGTDPAPHDRDYEVEVEPRLSVLDDPRGAWACENHFNCTRVCPREIKVTKNINATKAVLARHKEGRA
jgi:succinate dehydrogenase/fumarate reductase-like Fe-S protein